MSELVEKAVDDLVSKQDAEDWLHARRAVEAVFRTIEVNGYKVVPAMPTDDMAVAGYHVLLGYYPDDLYGNHRASSWAYLAMLKAAPKVTP